MALRKSTSDVADQYEAFAKPEDVVTSRAGDVLIKNTLLKADHFPGKLLRLGGQALDRKISVAELARLDVQSGLRASRL